MLVGDASWLGWLIVGRRREFAPTERTLLPHETLSGVIHNFMV
jgi:hypothetical protein